MSIRRYLIRKLGEHRGSPRLYIDTMALKEAGFEPGASYTRHVDKEAGRIVLKLDPIGTHRVSKKEKSGNTMPVIDINSREALSPLDGLQAVRLVIQDGMIAAMAPASQLNARRRLHRLREHLVQGRVVTGSLSHGGGILDNAAHAGLASAGVDSSLAFANEIDEGLMEHSSKVNEIWDMGTIGIGAGMQEAVQDEWLMQRLPQIDVLAVGIPCSGASKAGAAKRKLELMENHPEVGHLAASFLMMVQRTQPAVVVVECVQEYANTGSAQIIRQHLRDSGYNVNEVTLKGEDFGVLECRKRWFLVAATNGITIELDKLEPACTPVRIVAEALDEIADDDAIWRSFDYLKAKAVRDVEKGNNFSMQLVQPTDTFVPTLRKGYHKGGSTDPLLAHPRKEGLYRLFTAKEHARIKQIPDHLIVGMSECRAHQLLGQSVLFTPVKALFNRIGQALAMWVEGEQTSSTYSAGYNLIRATG
ncbi:DNA cytosine methyltransferase [Hydrogenophaga sp. NFH-34]|uniref:DNA cytosine methyltransferase n=1 Tax=Hydrogenophaga sp. NFH-34 TaxID=2744446 RepID=UPI001F18A02F|nr:DNA cytosine methyltransferase [Hydrogenophaga sp. NFH-34]